MLFNVFRGRTRSTRNHESPLGVVVDSGGTLRVKDLTAQRAYDRAARRVQTKFRRDLSDRRGELLSLPIRSLQHFQGLGFGTDFPEVLARAATPDPTHIEPSLLRRYALDSASLDESAIKTIETHLYVEKCPRCERDRGLYEHRRALYKLMEHIPD